MCADISRRDLLRAAGGLTFLALVPEARGQFTLGPWTSPAPPRPVFTALPYVQPGNGSRLVADQEETLLAWQTDARTADFDLPFTVAYGQTNRYGRAARVTMACRWSGDKGDSEARLNYTARFSGLALGARYEYRLGLGDHTIAEGYFTTRKPRGAPTRFVAFGDNAFGEKGERAIAYYAYQALPDFIMNTGDNVYERGLDHEYARYFFPVYNADDADEGVGAPLLRSIPFYTVMGNHDVPDWTGHGPLADFDAYADSLAYFTNLHLPLNAPVHAHPTPIAGAQSRLDAFRRCAGDRFPRMANYSFDYGDGHFLCLDSNVYVDPTDAAWQQWIAADLAGTDAAWKFVVYHHPAFNVGLAHYHEQHMRVLSPIFERHGVSVVFHGHEHNYQRTRPIRFAPAGPGAAPRRNASDRLVPGTFTVDRAFDGRRVTRPQGVIYVTTGAGGNKHLYDGAFTDTPSRWVRPEDGNVAYVASLVADRHSFTVVDMLPHALVLRQVDESGKELDRILVTRD